MPINNLIQAVHVFLDSEVMLDQQRAAGGDPEPPAQAFERARRGLSEALMNASNVPADRSLVVEAETYLAATAAFASAMTSSPDGVAVAGPARRVERAQQNLQDMLSRYAREAASHDQGRQTPACPPSSGPVSTGSAELPGARV